MTTFTQAMTDTKQSELLSLRINVEEGSTGTCSTPSNQSEAKMPQHMPTSDSSDIQCYCGKTLKMKQLHGRKSKCDECRELIESENFYCCNNNSYHCGCKYLCVKCVHNHEPPQLQIYGKNVRREIQRFVKKPVQLLFCCCSKYDRYSDMICDGCSNIIKGEEFVYPVHQIRIGSHFCQKCADEPPDRDIDRVVSTLQEDIWSMAYVMIKSGSGLRCSFLLLMIFVYIIQVISLGLLVWGYMFSLRHDVIIQYQISEENADTSSNTLNLIEPPAKYQTYKEPNHAAAHPASSFFFGLSSLMSMLLLSFYIFSTFTNQAVMLAIAAREDARDEKEEFHDNYSKCALITFCGCCKGNKVSSLLRFMAWGNVLLSFGAFGIGLVILSVYSLYFGLQNPTDIIFTPISIVFILEIDDWAFSIAKNYYRECYDEELWKLKVKDFQLFDFNRMYYKSAGLIQMCWGNATLWGCGIVWMYNGYIDLAIEATDEIRSATKMQMFFVISTLDCLAFILLMRYSGHHCVTNCCNKTVVEDGKGTSNQHCTSLEI